MTRWKGLAQGKYGPRLFCEYFAHGIRRTFWYELVDEDEFPDPNGDNPECHYGLIRRDPTPKPAYTALKSLLTLLDDPNVKPGFRPGALRYALDVHHLLLQKSDGTFTLLLWHEIADEDTSVTPHRQIQPPALPATLTLPPSVGRATVYTYDDGGVLRPALGVIAAGGKLSLSVSDRVMVVTLRSSR